MMVISLYFTCCSELVFGQVILAGIAVIAGIGRVGWKGGLVRWDSKVDW